MTWLNLTMPNEAVKNGLNATKIKLSQMNFFLEKQLIKCSCIYWPLSFCIILEKLLQLIQSYEDVPFSGPKYPICPVQNFLLQTIVITQGMHPPPAWGDGRGGISQKPLLGEGESDLFILEGEAILLGGGVILLGESRNFEVKIKIA